MITSGEGKYQVWLEKYTIGSNLLYSLGGGEKSHIGGVVICEPDKEPHIVKLGTHYDTIVLLPIAQTACEKYHTTVVAVGGVHVDNASKEEIERLVENCQKLHYKL